MKPDWTPEETNVARSLRDSGLTYAVIGKRVGRSAQGVKRRLQYPEEIAAWSSTPSIPDTGARQHDRTDDVGTGGRGRESFGP
jgi:hypothetical protein